MVLRRIYKTLTRSLVKKRPRKPAKKLRRPKRHPADRPPASGRCLLLELPTEVRLRILQYTLCEAEAIQARSNIKSNFSYDSPYYDYDNLIEYDEWQRGKPRLQILSCCRQLYQEGSDVFYNKNTFAITICDPGYGVYGNVDMLGMGDPQSVFDTHPRLSQCPNLRFNLYLGQTVSCNSLGYGTCKDSLDEAIEQVFQTWKGRGKLEVEVSQPGKLWVDHPIGAPALLHKFGLFRCKSVWFYGVPFSIACRLTSLMESDQPAVDLQRAYRDLSLFLDKTYIRDDAYETTYAEMYTEAERFAALHDVENFLRVRKTVITAALAQMKSGFARVQEHGATVQDEEIPIRTAGERSAVDQTLIALLNDF